VVRQVAVQQPAVQPAQPFQAPAPKPSQTSAKVTVRLPSDARLWVDNVYCPLSSNVRSFNTPQLEPGRRYYYTLRAEINRDGQVVSQNRRVIVSAGAAVEVNFGDLTTAVASNP
jgi:uncharacterized protein (TIGR03000 family)